MKNRPDIIVTGVGMTATAFELACRFSKKKYHAAINLGICGSFNRQLQIGETVIVREDIFSELGAESDNQFLPLHELKLGAKKDTILVPEKQISLLALKKYKSVKAITVNTVHGNELSIAKVISRFKPDVESMEGAAFFFACNRFKIPCLQLRSVSNYMEKRNVKNWNIPLALRLLNEAAIELIGNLQERKF